LVTVSSVPTILDSTATISYELLLSASTSFTDAVSIDFTFTGAAGALVKVKNSDLNTAVLDLTNSEDASTIYIKMNAYLVAGGSKTMQSAKTSSGSSTLSMTIDPYSVLKPFSAVSAVHPYYIVGLGGNWNNSVDGLGSSLIPLGLVSGNAYNTDGAGTFVYTGYFSASTSFKLVGVIGGWNEQWGSSDGALTAVHNDGGSSNFAVPSDGYYTITLNSIKNTLKIEAASVSPTSYTQIGLIGDINGWGSDVVMTANSNTNGHVWYTTYTFTGDASQGIKFRANGGWDINWGSPNFPYGFGVQNGDNIMYTAGTYTIIFNDMSGVFYFIAH
jgi:starch-binding outer membrane protein SusE/F